jgi:cell division protein FtsZ
MQGEIRVTVIATGFDKDVGLGSFGAGGGAGAHGVHTPEQPVAKIPPAVIPFPARPTRPVGTTPQPQRYVPPAPASSPAPDIPRNTGNGRSIPNERGQDLSDMEIPTFIRRQMD